MAITSTFGRLALCNPTWLHSCSTRTNGAYSSKNWTIWRMCLCYCLLVYWSSPDYLRFNKGHNWIQSISIQLTTQPIGHAVAWAFFVAWRHKRYFYDRVFTISRSDWLFASLTQEQMEQGRDTWCSDTPIDKFNIHRSHIAVHSNWSCWAAKRWANVGRQPLRGHHHLAMCHAAIKAHIRKILQFLLISKIWVCLKIGDPQFQWNIKNFPIDHEKIG